MKKYLFGLIVTSYVVTSIGIPVYLHYCGGELEEISYLTKATSCCGEEEDENSDDGCCKNESHILINTTDFTLENVSSTVPLKSITDLFYLAVYFSSNTCDHIKASVTRSIESPPPRLQLDRLISATVLRI